MISKISIGTAQFGLDYGISNQRGKVPFSDAENIIELAYSRGIDKLDTASAYGKSEKVLGEIGVKNFKITSKIPTIPSDAENINDFLVRTTESSLVDLKIDKFNCILVHDCYQFFQKKYHDEYIKALVDLKSSNLTTKIGLSVYDPLDDSIMRVIDHIDIIQSSFNIFDQRLNQKDLVGALNANNIEVQARSIFLRVIRFALFGVYISIKETIWASSQRKGHGAFPKVLTNIGMNCTIKVPVSYTIFINNEAGKRLCQ